MLWLKKLTLEFRLALEILLVLKVSSVYRSERYALLEKKLTLEFHHFYLSIAFILAIENEEMLRALDPYLG